eukprot:COSAG03_NODE_1493_length_3981_cov_6.421175_1_plen_91_part_10
MEPEQSGRAPPPVHCTPRSSRAGPMLGVPVGVAFHQFHSLPPRGVARAVQRAGSRVRRSEGARTHAHEHGSTQHAPRSTQRARCMWRGCWC